MDNGHEVHMLQMLLEHDSNSIIDGYMVLALCVHLPLTSTGHNSLGRSLFTV